MAPLVKRKTIQIAVKRESEQSGDVNFTEASHSLNRTQAFSLVHYLRGWLKEQHEKLFPKVPITTDLVNEVIENKYFRAPLSRVWSSDEITLNSFSYTLGQLRSKKNLTQEAVATNAGITTTTLQNLENKRTGNSYIKILKLCKLLSIEPKDLQSQNLTELLQAKGIKQLECAKQLGGTEIAIQQMTRRIQRNSDRTLNALIEIFNQLECEVEDFIPPN